MPIVSGWLLLTDTYKIRWANRICVSVCAVLCCVDFFQLCTTSTHKISTHWIVSMQNWLCPTVLDVNEANPLKNLCAKCVLRFWFAIFDKFTEWMTHAISSFLLPVAALKARKNKNRPEKEMETIRNNYKFEFIKRCRWWTNIFAGAKCFFLRFFFCFLQNKVVALCHNNKICWRSHHRSSVSGMPKQNEVIIKTTNYNANVFMSFRQSFSTYFWWSATYVPYARTHLFYWLVESIILDIDIIDWLINLFTSRIKCWTHTDNRTKNFR